MNYTTPFALCEFQTAAQKVSSACSSLEYPPIWRKVPALALALARPDLAQVFLRWL